MGMGNDSPSVMMTFQEVYAKLERVFCAELVHGGWCIFKTEKHIILERALQGKANGTDLDDVESRRAKVYVICQRLHVFFFYKNTESESQPGCS